MQFLNALPSHVARSAARAALLSCLALGAGCDRINPPAWKGTPVTPPRTVVQTEFTDSLGKAVQLLPVDGEAALVFFGYTNCPDVCPTTLADWARVKQAMGDDARRVRFVFVSVDPARDTPAVAQRYAAQFDPTFLGLSTTAARTEELLAAFGANAVKQASHTSADHVTAHSAQAFLVDHNGAIVVAFRYGAGWDVVSADLKTLLDQ